MRPAQRAHQRRLPVAPYGDPGEQTEHRLEHKKSKRDLEWSDDNVRGLEAEHRMVSEPGRDAPGERLLARWPHLVVDNTDLEPGTVAERILTWLVTRQ